MRETDDNPLAKAGPGIIANKHDAVGAGGLVLPAADGNGVPVGVDDLPVEIHGVVTPWGSSEIKFVKIVDAGGELRGSVGALL